MEPQADSQWTKITLDCRTEMSCAVVVKRRRFTKPHVHLHILRSIFTVSVLLELEKVLRLFINWSNRFNTRMGDVLYDLLGFLSAKLLP